MTAGLAFEAMNHAGIEKSNVLIILNDNCMSIDPNVGALKEYLTDITTSHTYNDLRDNVWKALGKLPVGKSFSRGMASKLEARAVICLKHYSCVILVRLMDII